MTPEEPMTDNPAALTADIPKGGFTLRQRLDNLLYLLVRGIQTREETLDNIERTLAPGAGLDVAWDRLRAEAQAFEAWYLPSRMGVNAWVGIDTHGPGFYGGWSVEGDPLYYDWDESEMTTAAGDSPEAVIDDLIAIARRYRERTDELNAELRDPEPAGATE